MYEELIKSLHCCFGFDSHETDCDNCMMKDKRKKYNYEGCCDALALSAIDAIVELQKENKNLIQENSFLKLMQQQLIKDVPENELGKKVYSALKMCRF